MMKVMLWFIVMMYVMISLSDWLRFRSWTWCSFYSSKAYEDSCNRSAGWKQLHVSWVHFNCFHLSFVNVSATLLLLSALLAWWLPGKSHDELCICRPSFPLCVSYISLRFSIVIGLDINLYNVAHDVRMEPQVSYILASQAALMPH